MSSNATNSGQKGDQSATSSSSGGEGGLFGNASASVGDVGIGTSAAESGDVNTRSTKMYSFAGPTINRNSMPVWGWAVLGLGAFWFLKKGRK